MKGAKSPGICVTRYPKKKAERICTTTTAADDSEFVAPDDDDKRGNASPFTASSQPNVSDIGTMAMDMRVLAGKFGRSGGAGGKRRFGSQCLSA